jgi:hypothetical protein
MNQKNLQFISPGVFIKEIDQSGTPAFLDEDGPCIIGRATKGPAMRPVTVSSYDQLVDMFGVPTPGSTYSDVWRDNKITGPTYGLIAAEAALRGRKNVTFVRLLGTEGPEATLAGRAGWSVGSVDNSVGGGAYGLYLFNSGSTTTMSGTLAAVWYLSTGSIALSGTLATGGTSEGNAALFKLSNKEAKVVIRDENNNIVEESTFNFNQTSDRFVRKVFNTNPTRINSSLYDSTERKNYFLGESFEDFINNSEDTTVLRNSSEWHGVIFALKHNTLNLEHNNKKMPFNNSKTGWFFRQDLSTATGSYDPYDMDKLFRFHSLDSGEFNQNNIKISLTNIKTSSDAANPYGTFGVLVRSMNDTDSNINILEQFYNIDLNPNSERFISKVIGDKYNVFDTTSRYNVEYGEFDNKSKYIRVEVSDLVSDGVISPESLPFGVFGPVKYSNFAICSGSAGSQFTDFNDYDQSFNPFTKGGTAIANSLATGLNVLAATGFATELTASVVMPKLRLKQNTVNATNLSPRNTFFGVDVNNNSNRFSDGIKDITRVLASGVSNDTPSDTNSTEYSWVFTLDNVRWYYDTNTLTFSNTNAEYVENSRVAGTSLTATGSVAYQRVLDSGFNKFTTVLTGGFDGLDITEIEPFRNSGLSNKNENNSYAFNTIKRAIDIIRDPEEVDYNVLMMPGLTNYSLNNILIDLASTRGDAVCLFDTAGGYQPRSEGSTDPTQRLGSVDETLSEIKSYSLNTSYAATYYPWVQVRESISGNLLYVPPSVAAIGVWSSTDNNFAEWYSPAGFSRGGLSNGAAGLTVTNIAHQVRKEQRDRLYEEHINPIAKITKEGIVIWGQKTLLKTPSNSSLNRLNVRRGMIAIKKTISRIAATTIFEANNQATWNNFTGRCNPYLEDVKARFGLEEFKLILDNTTTTPDLIDRNILYAKLFIKPTKVAEGIFLDFTITNQGANFELL